MTTLTVNERAEAPDWRALAEAEGADPGIAWLSHHPDDCWLIPHGSAAIGRGLHLRIYRDGDRWTVTIAPNNDHATARDALRAALAWLRETLDREIAERVAARGRLGE